MCALPGDNLSSLRQPSCCHSLCDNPGPWWWHFGGPLQKDPLGAVLPSFPRLCAWKSSGSELPASGLRGPSCPTWLCSLTPGFIPRGGVAGSREG